jgi:hypothetical protein
MFIPFPKRRLQFGLRTLFALMFVAALASVVYGWQLRDSILQDLALRQIAEKGGYVHYYGDGYHHGAYITFYPGASQLPAGVHVHGHNKVFVPKPGIPSFDDADFKLFERIPDLGGVEFANTKASITSMRQLQKQRPRCVVSYRGQRIN